MRGGARGLQGTIRLEGMDKVRFGRALGTGAREAAKALLKAADAATAPDPSPPLRQRTAPTVQKPVQAAAQRARVRKAGLKQGGKRFGEAAWGPVAKAGGVLWLEVTGVLFGLFAVAAGIAVWQDRGNFRAGGAAEHHAWVALGMLVVFGYFTVSNYVKAARRSRR
jgi:hypothetical protein